MGIQFPSQNDLQTVGVLHLYMLVYIRVCSGMQWYVCLRVYVDQPVLDTGFNVYVFHASFSALTDHILQDMLR